MRAPHASFALTLALAAATLTACEQGATPNQNANTNALQGNANSNALPNQNANMPGNQGGLPAANTAPGGTSSIEAREPDTYQTNIAFTAQTAGGQQAMALPTITANFAKLGGDKRLAVTLPNNEQIVYLNKGATRYIILPNRRQYAEVTSNAVGFQLPEFMTPGQLVNRLQNQSGYQRVGEEQFNGRTAIRYRYADTRATGTQAGNVQSESYVLVDQATGLPLRAELASQATGGSVQGMNNLRVIAEMRDLNTNVNASLFDLPQGFNRISEEQLRQQINAFAQIAGQIFGAVMQNMNNAQQPR